MGSAGFKELFRVLKPRNRKERNLVTSTVYQLLRFMSEAEVGEELRFGVFHLVKVTDRLFYVKVSLGQGELLEAGLEELERRSVIRM